jgi:hypothetical protein
MGVLMRRVALAAAAIVLAAGAAAAEPLEYAVKAAFLSKFGFYVDWPNGAFAGPGSPLNLCVVGDDPFGSMLDDAAAGQREGRPIVVRRLKAAARDSDCHIAYVGGDARAAASVDGLRGSAALVVTDARNPAPATGVIHFVVRDNRVRFTIDDEAAAQNGLAISSKLLGLALSVKPRGGR